ncbi:MAG TPA: NAD(+) synthase [Candidatus Rifleibacterium sp.]|nr:NAD(+) synthase [Candidatus Rifleibacterium sp.]
MSKAFNNPYSHGFFRCAAARPVIAIGQPEVNARRQIELINQLSQQRAGIVVFPELSLTGYTLGDLFQQKTILDAAIDALQSVAAVSADRDCLIVTGLPLLAGYRLFNCAAVIHRGQILGLVPKTWLPDHREFYEKRQFCSSRELDICEVIISGSRIPIGTDLLFACRQFEHVKIGIEICEDLWAPLQPSTSAAMAGATLICNLSASNIVIGKAEYRRLLVKASSGRNICGYVYCSAGEGESTTDMAWDGHMIIAENGALVEESKRFSAESDCIITDLDLEKLQFERLRNNSFRDSAAEYCNNGRCFRTIDFDFAEPQAGELPLMRRVPRFPYVPDEDSERSTRCEEVLNIQVQGICTRLKATGVKKAVIGISGGLDSTLALLVTHRAFIRLGLPVSGIVAVTMPGFATSEHTRNIAIDLMRALAVDYREIDIKPSCLQMLKDLGHPFAAGKKQYDITFENVQAGERTSHLFRIANHENGLVVGTGDLSELALGWCTYGVGDHMSHYNVNASVPKTLVKFLISHLAEAFPTESTAARTLQKVLAATISPELIPVEGEEQVPQQTEATVGPYELQDLHLYYISRFGFKPSKVAYLCWQAWLASKKYSLPTIKNWLKVFIKRFFAASQFKRSCVPDSPKIGSGGSLSPRGDWRAPSDMSAETWLAELEKNIP